MVLLDTDIVSHLAGPRRRAPVAARLARIPRHRQFTTTITVGELLYGLARRGGRPELRTELQELVLDRIEALPFDFAAAEEYARLRLLLERRGTPLPEPDRSEEHTSELQSLE